MGKADGFENLEAWKKAREFRKVISTIVRNFPPEEKYLLTQQIKKSSRSISANISEGYGRFHYKESTKHCRIARGSLTETLDHLIVALDEGYIGEGQLAELRIQYEHCLKLLNGYIKYLNDNQKSGK